MLTAKRGHISCAAKTERIPRIVDRQSGGSPLFCFVWYLVCCILCLIPCLFSPFGILDNAKIRVFLGLQFRKQRHGFCARGSGCVDDAGAVPDV